MAEICPKCGYENAHGALYCAECYSLLATTTPMATVALSSRDAANLVNQKSAQSTGKTQHEGLLGPHSVAIYINNSLEPLIMLLTSQTIFGRAVPGDSQPRVDLTPYGAQEYGVSRQHAILKRTEKGIVIEDMGSSNGSWLNDKLLKPYSPARVQSGDRLRLSRIELEVYLPEM